MNVVALARMDTFILLFYHRITFATVLLFGSLDAIRHGHVEMLGFGTALITGPSFLIIKFQINACSPPALVRVCSWYLVFPTYIKKTMFTRFIPPVRTIDKGINFNESG